MENKTKEYTYSFVDGEMVTVKIEPKVEQDIDWADVLAELDRDEALNERRETRRHCSYEEYDLGDINLRSKEFIEDKYIYKEMFREFVKILTELEQVIYVRRYIEGVPQVEVAAQLNVTKGRICNKEREIREKFKKFKKNWNEG